MSARWGAKDKPRRGQPIAGATLEDHSGERGTVATRTRMPGSSPGLLPLRRICTYLENSPVFK